MNIQESAKQYFGVTNDYKEAGYILPDGTMLDLSGKHEVPPEDAKYYRHSRTVDHRMLGGENYNGFSLEPWIGTGDGGELMCRFMQKSGAMRVDFKAHIASAMTMPTAKQIQVLYYGVRGSYLMLSAWNKNADLINDVEFEYCSVKSITQWFKNNIGGKSLGIRASTREYRVKKVFARNDKVTNILRNAIEKDENVMSIGKMLIALNKDDILIDSAMELFEEYGIIEKLTYKVWQLDYEEIDETDAHELVSNLKMYKCKNLAQLLGFDDICYALCDEVNQRLMNADY